MTEYKLTDIVNSLLINRDTYKKIPNDIKESYFFIINRFLSKKYPHQSQMFNNKNVDKSLALDLWFLFLRHENKNDIKRWIWKKSSKKNDGDGVDINTLTKKEYNMLMSFLDVRKEDIDMLMIYNLTYIKEELKYLKQLYKINNK